MTGTGSRYGIIPKDLEESRAENRPPRRDLVRDCTEAVAVRDGLAWPVLAGYTPRPALAAQLRAFVAWLEKETR